VRSPIGMVCRTAAPARGAQTHGFFAACEVASPTRFQPTF
jgi:hypothetical protein